MKRIQFKQWLKVKGYHWILSNNSFMQLDSGKVRDHKQLFYKQSPMWLTPGTSLNKDKVSDQYTTKNKTEIAHSLH